MRKINDIQLKELFIEIKNNNKIAFEKLYNQYNKLVYGIAFSILKNNQDSEDIVQNVFTKLYTMDKSKLPNNNEATWIYSVTKNETLNFLQKKHSDISLENVYEIEDTDNEINEIIDKDTYNRLISKLDDKEKEIISLKILANFSFDEIGTLLNKPTGTIKWKYYKSIHTLKILLGNLGMFFVSFISSIIFFKNGAKKSDTVKEDVCDTEDNNFIEDEEIKREPTEENKENIISDENEEQIQENVVVDVPVRNNINYMGIGFMGISSVFFITTIIFSIIFAKHQLKRRKKLSK